MENLVQGFLTYLGAPAALITPTVGAVIIAGFAFKSYEEAKESANREGTPIYKHLYFWASIALCIWSLSGFWMAGQVLIAIAG